MSKRFRGVGALAPLAVWVALAALLATRGEPGRFHWGHSLEGPSRRAWFGFGEAGIELGAYVGHATLRVLLLAAVVALLGVVIGGPLGALAAMRRGAFERFVLATCDLVQSFPTFLLALAVLCAVSVPSRWHLVGVFGLTAWAPFARLAAARARSLSQADFVVASRALGATSTVTLFRHVLPHLVAPLAVQLGTSAAGVVLGETALAFVGLGPSDGVSLGSLLEQGSSLMLRAPHILAWGACAVTLTSGGLQLASEGLRRRLLVGR